MFDMLNIYQQQMDLVNRIQPVYSSGLVQITQHILDSYNKQMLPIQIAQKNYSDLQERMAALMRPFAHLTLNPEFTKANSTLIAMRKQFNSINRLYDSLNMSKLNTLAQSVSVQRSALEAWAQSLSISQMNSATAMLRDLLTNIPDSVYDTILEDDGYTRQDIEEEITLLDDDDSSFSIEGLSPDEVQQKWWERLWVKHPNLASALVKMILVLTAIGTVGELTTLLKDIVIPAAQNAIVHFQEKENSYFIKVDSARIYEAPNSHSASLTNALYGDEVNKLEDVKLWVKVSYKTTDGEKITGWIAKRNLMPYRDYEFDSDKLYE